jgi:hypothetical protein
MRDVDWVEDECRGRRTLGEAPNSEGWQATECCPGRKPPEVSYSLPVNSRS